MKKFMSYPEYDDLGFETHCKQIARQLKSAQNDLEYIKKNPDNAKSRCRLIESALSSARHYLQELERSLD
jgi:hypothetical protein